MCGICGKFVFKDCVPERALIEAMCKTIVHRGPDDEGIYVAPNIGLGQRRLTIIDLDKSACPPLSNEDKSIWLVFNGEIYNYVSLRENLENLGHRFKTKSDTEVLIHLYEEEGFKCLNSLRGMFAFALWDERKKILFCARDRLGKKPFCYSLLQDSFIFGSEIKSILVDPAIRAVPNYHAIDQYLSFSYVPSPQTAFAGIQRLRPGEYLVCGMDGKINLKKFWSPESVPLTQDQPEVIKQKIFEQLNESVKLRMISDVPLGAFLSGGIDSATIVALMARNSSKPIKTFSIGFEDDEFNELPYARILAERYGTEHHEMIVKPEAAEILPLLVRYYNEPFADSSALPSFYVSLMTKKHVTVALSGDGGDESFAGYENYASIMAWKKLDFLPSSLRKGLANFGSKLLSFGPENFSARGNRALRMFCSDNIKERKNLFSTTVKEDEKKLLYSPSFAERLEKDFCSNNLEDFPYSPETDDELAWLMRHDQNFYLPDCLMVKTDIASMANSLEVRCPFLDHNLIEYAATIPSCLKRNAEGGKLILKDSVSHLLPEELLNKPKTGFSIPLARWLRQDLAETLKEALLSHTFIKRNLFNQGFIEKMVFEHIEGTRDWSNRLWALTFLELWFREFID